MEEEGREEKEGLKWGVEITGIRKENGERSDEGREVKSRKKIQRDIEGEAGGNMDEQKRKGEKRREVVNGRK